MPELLVRLEVGDFFSRESVSIVGDDDPPLIPFEEQLNLNHLFLRPPAKPSATVIKLNTLRLADTLRALDGMIAGDYVLPSGFSAADAMLGFNLFAALYYVRLDPWPNLQAYWARLQERPAFQAAAAIEGPQTFYAQDFYEVPEDD